MNAMDSNLLIVPVLITVTDSHRNLDEFTVILGEIVVKPRIAVGLWITDRIPLADFLNDVYGNRPYFLYLHDILPHFTISTF